MKRAARSWEVFGREDPLGAILTREGGERWDEAAFFATGREDVERLLRLVEPHRDLGTIERVLDFGCGAGRLTLALAERFADVHGVDVAESMVACARRLAGDGARCTFHVNPHADLHTFYDGRFDLAVSLLTLQHLPPRDALRYVGELCRVLAPGGIAVFQLPVAPRRGTLLGDKPLLRRIGPLLTRVRRALHVAWLQRVRRRPVMDMYGCAPERVAATVHDAGCELLATHEDASAGPDWESRVYVARAAVTPHPTPSPHPPARSA